MQKFLNSKVKEWKKVNDSQPTQQETDPWESEELEDGESYGGTENDAEPEVSTMNNLEEAIKQLASMDGIENIYVELPKLDLKKCVVDNEEIMNDLLNGMSGWKIMVWMEGKSSITLTLTLQSLSVLLRKKSTIW